MIDTLKLHLVDYTVSKNSKLIIQPAAYQHSDGVMQGNYDLFVDENGELISGSRAYFNHDKFNLTILPHYTTELRTDKKEIKFKRKSYDVVFTLDKNEEIFNSKCFVQLSIPRYKNETNFKPVSIKNQIAILTDLEYELKKIGIKTNIFKSTISRVDTFTNLQTDEKFYNYKNVFDLINMSRKKAVDWNGQTYLWKNKQSQVTVYDKIEEMQYKLRDKFPVNRYPPNVMRIEVRRLTKRNILNQIGVTNLDHLYAEYDELKKQHKETIIHNLFKYEPKELEVIQSDSLYNELMRFYKSGNRFWFNKFLTANGLKRLLTITSLDTIKKIIDEMDIEGSESRKRVVKHRIKKKMEQAEKDLKYLYLNNENFKTDRELYLELKNKFLKAA